MTSIEEEKWAAVRDIFGYLGMLLRTRGECDQLCRLSEHTRYMTATADDVVIRNDTPEMLNDRVRFVREFSDEMQSNRDAWQSLVKRKTSARRNAEARSFMTMCPRCGRTECAGAITARLHVVNVSIQK